MAGRGDTKYDPHLDDQMKHETQGVVHANQPPQAEEWRGTGPFPDGTDPAEIQEALNPVAVPQSISDEGER